MKQQMEKFLDNHPEEQIKEEVKLKLKEQMGIDVIDRVYNDDEINSATFAKLTEMFQNLSGKLVKHVPHE